MQSLFNQSKKGLVLVKLNDANQIIKRYPVQFATYNAFKAVLEKDASSNFELSNFIWE